MRVLFLLVLLLAAFATPQQATVPPEIGAALVQAATDAALPAAIAPLTSFEPDGAASPAPAATMGASMLDPRLPQIPAPRGPKPVLLAPEPPTLSSLPPGPVQKAPPRGQARRAA